MGSRREIKTLVEARQINLVDDKGRVRATLNGGEGTHGPIISLNDDTGRQRLIVSLERDGFPVVSLLNENGSTGVGFGIGADRRGITLTMPDGKPGIMILIHPDGEPHLEAFDASGKSKWRGP